MKPPQREVPRSRWQTVANAVAAFAVAVFALWQLSYVSVIWNPGRYGDVGLTIGDQVELPEYNSSYLVTSIVSGYPAEKAGIKLGDRVDAALPTRARLVLIGILAPRPGEEVTIHTSRGRSHRTVTLQARPLAPLPAADDISLALQAITSFIFVAVGLALVLLRPSRMTWGFYLLGFAWISGALPHNGHWPLSNTPTGFWIGWAVSSDVLLAAGAVGILIFSLSFPTNAPTGWLRTIDILTPYLVAMLAIVLLRSDLGTQLLIPPVELTRLSLRVWFAGITAVTILGSVVLLVRFFAAHGQERYRIRWVVLGFTCAAIAVVVSVLSWGEGPLAGLPDWFIGIFGLLVVVFPLTVAYAVLRHRVIDVRFVIGRSLVVVTVAAIVTIIVIAVDWLFSAKLPSSRFETATYFAIALLIGLSLNWARQRIGKTIDSLFFRQWSRSQEQADTIADVIRHSMSKADLYEPLTSGIQSAFSLTSVALFERVEDGGFVRVVADGWPTGTIWHILPDDPLIKRADNRLRVVDIDSIQWGASDLPSGLARPAVLIPLVAGRRVLAILLLGAHENGTALAPDELRLILRLVADAGPVFATGSTEVVRAAAAVVRAVGT
jgi:hypothetical protein